MAQEKNVIEEFRWRGMIHSISDGTEQELAENKVVGYIGFDPTAASLHVGSLLPVMALVHLQRFGHTPIAVVGGGTGMIGDPSGKSVERKLMTVDEVERNVNGIRKQIERLLNSASGGHTAKILNNADWLLQSMTINFLRDIGKHFTVNNMLAKESIEKRINAGEGISFTEFSYMLLQAFDFLMLNEKHNCTLQMGGSDQWGNITAGIDLIRKVKGTKAYGVVFPLITTASGTKFGKSEEGTVWLDPALTSPYKFYQYFINTDDRDAVKFLRFFTLLSRDEILEIESEFKKTPEKRLAQRRLAEEVTKMVHGEDEFRKARAASEILFSGEIEKLTLDQVMQIFQDVPSATIAPANAYSIVDMLVVARLSSSRGDARRTIEGGGIYVNGRQVTDPKKQFTLNDAIEGKVFLLRKGSKNYSILHVA